MSAILTFVIGWALASIILISMHLHAKSMEQKRRTRHLTDEVAKLVELIRVNVPNVPR
jgi:hypothetical protein